MQISHIKIMLGCVFSLSISACQQPLTPKQQQTETFLLKKPTYDKATNYCRDFLSQLNIKPIEATFTGCQAGFYDNAHALIASYHLSGKDAFSVQEQLHHATNMPRLVKDCCLWESRDETNDNSMGKISKNGHHYYVKMHSNELRLGWDIASDIDQIANFTINVIYPLPQ